MKKLLSILLVILMLFSLVACAANSNNSKNDSTSDTKENKTDSNDSKNDNPSDTKEDKTYHIAVLSPTLSVAFPSDLQSGVLKAAEKYDNVKMTEVVYDMDLNKGVESIMNLVSQGIDAIVLHPMDNDAFNTAVDSAREAGVVVVTVDGTINTDVDCAVSIDNYSSGLLAGDYAGDYLGGKGEALVISAEPGNLTMMQRNKGFLDGLANYPDIKVTEVMGDHSGGTAEFANTIENALNANPDLDVIIANYSDCVYGALSVIESNPAKYGDVKVMGFDADDAIIESLKSGDTPLIGTIVQFPKVIGRVGLETAVAILNGESVEETVGTEVGLVTLENVSSFEMKD